MDNRFHDYPHAEEPYYPAPLIAALVVAIGLLSLLGWFAFGRVDHSQPYIEKSYALATSPEIVGEFEDAGYRIKAIKGFFEVRIEAMCIRHNEIAPVRCADVPHVPFKVNVVDGFVPGAMPPRP